MIGKLRLKGAERWEQREWNPSCERLAMGREGNMDVGADGAGEEHEEQQATAAKKAAKRKAAAVVD